MSVLASYSLKGGVGKTTTIVNLAYLSAREGNRTLLWDFDPQASATYCFRVESRLVGGSKRIVRGQSDPARSIRGTDFENLDLLPADFSCRHLDRLLDREDDPTGWLVRILESLGAGYDHVLLDCPTGLSRLTENIFRAADLVLVPVIPTVLAVRTFEQVRAFRDGGGALRADIVGFHSMVDRRKQLHRRLLEETPAAEDFLASWIPFSSAVERMTVERAPLASYDRRGRAARAYEALWNELGLALAGRRGDRVG